MLPLNANAVSKSASLLLEFEFHAHHRLPRSLILANNIILLSSKTGGGIAQTPLTDYDIRKINRIGQQPGQEGLMCTSIHLFMGSPSDHPPFP